MTEKYRVKAYDGTQTFVDCDDLNDAMEMALEHSMERKVNVSIHIVKNGRKHYLLTVTPNRKERFKR